MTKNRSEDKELWERVKRTTKPLDSNRYVDFPQPLVDEKPHLEKTFSQVLPKRFVQTHRENPGISFISARQQKLLDEPTRKKISKGKLTIEARLDLHGLTQVEAHAALQQFLERVWHAQKRTVLVITGKGNNCEGILKNMVPRWLNEPTLSKIVVGFHEAAKAHGGSGALYVRIRRKEVMCP